MMCKPKLKPLVGQDNVTSHKQTNRSSLLGTQTVINQIMYGYKHSIMLSETV